MKRGCIIFLLAMLGCSSVPKDRGPKPVASASCSDCPEESRFATTFENSSPRFFVRATVNGLPKRFLVDTGAYRSNLAIDGQTKSIAVVGKTRFASLSWNPMSCDWIRIQSFEALGIDHSGGKGVPILRCDSDPPMLNTLGLDYLDYHVLSLDMDDASFKSIAQIPDHVPTSEMKRSADRHILIPIQLAKHRQWALFDTGCSFTIIDRKLVSKYPHAFKKAQAHQDGKSVAFDVPVSSSDITGNPVKGELYTTDQLQVGDQKLPDQMVMVIPFPKQLKKGISSSIIFGATSMLQTNWIFDLYHDVWASAPSAHSSKVPPRFSVHADQVLTRDGKVILHGNADLFEKGHELSGDHIVFDGPAMTADCAGACSYKGGTTVKSEAMSFVISDQGWQRTK